ncbi:MAG: TonB-dependent receptor [Novosphingobium lindaniclasticum]|jgi:TonB-dependent receptor|uniref:TonB-dependent receptor n=1 Tax=Novosphingobium lindaniclasticum TaxID=1329895 RepID=UPI0024094C24|nr:TonB-dependent receptor [Novosphingobium lindaniclasticum]MDF2640329.1 TonB-dependent receptor [Novosphingobium lindaniclasticum]
MRIVLQGAVSAIAVLASMPAMAQEADVLPPPNTEIEGEGAGEDIIVTGVRQSLERAAEVKRDAVQVVDSIVATDIGKLPDPTVAAALQRVPGIQVQNDRNNELSTVRIRGLTDILTTVNGREVITTTGRGFDLQDVPAEALARIDAFKSQTVDQIEGGVAGAIDLRLNRPFSFREPTLVVTARQNYATIANAGNPQFGVLAAGKTDTSIGEIGALVNVTYSQAENIRSVSNLGERRYSGTTPLNVPGLLIPQVLRNMPDVGDITRVQANAAIQWQATPSLQVYADGLYTKFRSTTGFVGFNPQPFTNGSSISEITASDYCFDARVNAAGTNPTLVNNADGTVGIQPFTVQRVCELKSARFNNVVINQNSSSEDITQRNKMIAGGLNFEQGRTKFVLDVAYQTSRSFLENFNAEVGQRVPTVFVEFNDNNGPSFTLDPSIPLSSANLSLRNSINQNYTLGEGELFQARLDGEYEIGDILPKVKAGLRYAKREARFQEVRQTNTVQSIGFGNIGTPTEANARLISSLPLSPDFLSVIGVAPRLNGGVPFLGVNPAYLRSERGRNELRALFGLPLSQPDFDPTKEFNAEEATYAGYVEGSYEIPLGSLTLDGVVGTRLVRTERTISGFERNGATFTPVTASTTDTDFLPAATARLQFPGSFQTRLTYSRSIRRPDFASLNPTESLTLVGNVFLLNNGTRGNPDLRPQKSDSFDITAEYYFNSGYISVAGYYRSIKDRVVTSNTQETIDGLNYLISTPRNVGSVDLKGIEVSAQYFFDFLPGALSGFGVQGAFTLADSKIKGDDNLAGYALVGVSKYNYTAGLLYDKAGLSARLIWTHRSKYINADNSGGVALRPYDPARENEPYVPVFLTYVRPAGRLDFSIGYDVTEALRFDVGGTNILRSKTSSYWGDERVVFQLNGDETVYSLGARVKF